ncbi:MAG: sel1 repeat family protein [Desulfovibrionaceae bacterium]|nr:sel1 repeat family protein [Desulfovibrionaceae bacterium]
MSLKGWKGILIWGFMGFLTFNLWGFNAQAETSDAILKKAWEAYNIGHYKETLNLLQPLASDGNAVAQILVGRCYENGLGVAQDLPTAAKWYQLAAEQNNDQAQVFLGYCYEIGMGVAKDPAKTVELMTKAAKAGNAEAQFNLALYASKGLYGVKKDHKESFAFALKSAKQGYAQAERFVGACYEFGVGVEANADLAKEWYAKARAKGLEPEGNIFKTVHSISH